MSVITQITSFLREMSAFQILIVIIILYAIYDTWRKQITFGKLNSFYSKPQLPLIGHLHHVTGHMKALYISRKPDTSNTLNSFQSQSKSTTNLMHHMFEIMRASIEFLLFIFENWQFPAMGWIFHIPLVVVASPQDVKTVLHTSHDRGWAKKLKGLRNGILLSEDVQWRKSRRIIRAGFSTQMMNQYENIFNDYASELIRKLEPIADTGVSFNIWSYLANATTDMIYKNMADQEMNALKNDDYSHFHLIEEDADLDNTRYLHPLLYIDFIHKLFARLIGKQDVVVKVKQCIENTIQSKISRIRENNESISELQEKTLIDLLLKAQTTDATYTDDILRDDLLNMIQAGSITTTVLICFTLLMLAMHQDIQEKVHQEIKTILGDNESDKIENLNAFEYLEQCINETLRKFPPIMMTFRRHLYDIALNEKQTIPANCNIVVSLYALHHDKTQYSNVEDWDPENFSKQEVAKRDKNAFLPFGTGPRMCIGARYAMSSAKVQLIHILRNYELSTDTKMSDIQLIMKTVFMSGNGYWIKLRSRSK